MSNDEQAVEKRIVELGLTAPRLTPQDIDAVIERDEYTVMGLTTICKISLVNGFSVIGTSSCVSAENFNEEIGRDVAYKDARSKIWQLEGYRLCCELHASKLRGEFDGKGEAS